jgi:flagellar hook-basal body complex protein FliE
VSIAPIGAISSIAPIAATSPTSAASSTSGFGDALKSGLDNVQQLDNNADQMSLKAATGDLTDVHDYTIAANEASVATSLTAAVRDRAVSAFNEVMRMQV